MARWHDYGHYYGAWAGPIKMVVSPRRKNGWWPVRVTDRIGPGRRRKAARSLAEAKQLAEKLARDVLEAAIAELEERE